jgi:hypothetical protein
MKILRRHWILLFLAASVVIWAGFHSLSFTRNLSPGPYRLAGIVEARDSYLVSEGHGSRGKKFERLVMQLISPALPGKYEHARLMTVDDTIAVLGPPDLIKKHSGSLDLIYLFDRVGKKDWFVDIEFSKSDPYADFYFNARSELDEGAFQPFSERRLTEMISR